MLCFPTSSPTRTPLPPPASYTCLRIFRLGLETIYCTAKRRNETAPRNHTQHDRTQKRGKNSSLHNDNSSLNDTCPLTQLTRAKTDVYIITNSSYPHQEVPHSFFRQFAPCPIFPPFSQKLMLTKCRNNHHYLSGCPPGIKPFYYLSASVPIAAFLHRKCFPQTHARSHIHMPDSSAHNSTSPEASSRTKEIPGEPGEQHFQ